MYRYLLQSNFYVFLLIFINQSSQWRESSVRSKVPQLQSKQAHQLPTSVPRYVAFCVSVTKQLIHETIKQKKVFPPIFSVACIYLPPRALEQDIFYLPTVTIEFCSGQWGENGFFFERIIIYLYCKPFIKLFQAGSYFTCESNKKSPI